MAAPSYTAYRLLAQPGNPHLAIPIMAVITAHCYAIALRWDVRQRASVWAVVVASLALHAALILSVPWTTTPESLLARLSRLSSSMYSSSSQ